MDSTESSFSAIDAIDTVAFKIGVRGYNVDEVDDFLERLSGEVHQLKELVQQQRQQLRQAGERINQLDARPASAPAPAPAPAAPLAAPAPGPRSQRQREWRRTGDRDDRDGPAVH
jgi:DivIVA domain-containing protein